MNGKYIQWNEILRDTLNGKLKILQNRTRKSESETESEKGEIDEERYFEMENPDTSEKNGYKPIITNSEDELKLHTDGEMPTGENEKKCLGTENSLVRRSNRKCMQPNRYGRVRYTKNFWV